jgi:hypothetical protein
MSFERGGIPMDMGSVHHLRIYLAWAKPRVKIGKSLGSGFNRLETGPFFATPNLPIPSQPIAESRRLLSVEARSER